MCRTWLLLALVVVAGVDSYPQRWRRDASELPQSETDMYESSQSESSLAETSFAESSPYEPALPEPARSEHIISARALAQPQTQTNQKPQKTGRQGKSLGFYQPSYLSSPLMIDPEGILPYEDALASALASATYGDGSGTDDNELLSRARPGNKRPGNSPIYYIRLPATPYVYIPGVGYVSQPPQLQPPPVVQTRPDSPFLNVPVRYVSNAKPTGIYTLENDLPPTRPPPQNSPIINLNKGPYVFNGRPNDIYLLRDAYNSLYDEALTNFYP